MGGHMLLFQTGEKNYLCKCQSCSSAVTCNIRCGWPLFECVHMKRMNLCLRIRFRVFRHAETVASSAASVAMHRTEMRALLCTCKGMSIVIVRQRMLTVRTMVHNA